MKITIFFGTAIAAASAFVPSSDSTCTRIAPCRASDNNFYEYNTAPFGGPQEIVEPPKPPLGPTLNGWTPDDSEPCFGLPGAIPPLGYFDPLGLCPRTLMGVKRFREAEIVHGRVAMLASVGFIVSENFPTLTYGTSTPPLAINQVPDVPLLGILFPLFLVVNISEALRATRGWVDPSTGQLFALRESYYPGDLNFDPLGIKPKGVEEFKFVQERELANGRLAMMAVAGMCVQELVTGKPVLAALDDVLDFM